MVYERLRQIILDQLDELTEDDVTADSVLLEICASSLDLVDIVMSIEDEFGVEIPDDAPERFVTVGDVVDYLEDRI